MLLEDVLLGVDVCCKYDVDEGDGPCSTLAHVLRRHEFLGASGMRAEFAKAMADNHGVAGQLAKAGVADYTDLLRTAMEVSRTPRIHSAITQLALVDTTVHEGAHAALGSGRPLPCLPCCARLACKPG